MPQPSPNNLTHQAMPLPTPVHEPRPYRFTSGVGDLVLIGCCGLLTVFILGLCSAVLWAFAPVLGVLAGGSGLFLLIAAGAGVSRYQAERGNVLLNYLHAAVCLNLPLADYLDQVARGERGQLAREAKRVAQSLRSGLGLGETLMVVRTELARDQAAVVWRGEACGRAGAAMDRLSQLHRRKRGQTTTNDLGVGALGYTLLVLAIIIVLASGVGILIIPKFEEIAADFDTQLPWITTVTFDWLARLGPIITLMSVMLLLAMIGWPVFRGLVGGRGLIDGVRRCFEPLYWRLPVVSASHRNRAIADCCFLIEQAMRAGMPLDEAVSNASAPAVSEVMYRKMNLFAWCLTSGSDPAEAARYAHMPALLVGMLATAEHSDDPAACFCFLSRYYDHKINPLEVALRASALPLVTLLLAMISGWLVFAIFYPLVLLIEQTNAVTGYY